MQFTSGGTGGPSLDPLYLDVGPNFYAWLLRPAPLIRVAEAFHRAGWSVRKAAWDEYGVQHTWADLLITPPGLISGTVAPGHHDRMVHVLIELGVDCAVDPQEPDDPHVP